MKSRATLRRRCEALWQALRHGMRVEDGGQAKPQVQEQGPKEQRISGPQIVPADWHTPMGQARLETQHRAAIEPPKPAA